MCVLCVLCLSSDAVFDERFFNKNTPVCPLDAFSQGIESQKLQKSKKAGFYMHLCFRQILRDKTHAKSDDEGIDAVIIIINLLFDVVVAIVSF